jgi:hypothetical protein
MQPDLVTEKWKRPKSTLTNYSKTQEQAVTDFTQDNQVIMLLETGKFILKNYHALLKAIFHQVYFSSTSFAMAGAMSAHASVAARQYLLHHAEEEMNHWQWILEDLKSTGYKGADPREEHPNWAAQAYLSYGVYLSMFKPIGRLAMAQVLEGISAKFGGFYGSKLIQSLNLTNDSAKFFLIHGELDQGHTADIGSLLQKENLSAEDWSEMEHIAHTTATLYKNIYNLSVTIA